MITCIKPGHLPEPSSSREGRVRNRTSARNWNDRPWQIVHDPYGTLRPGATFTTYEVEIDLRRGVYAEGTVLKHKGVTWTVRWRATVTPTGRENGTTCDAFRMTRAGRVWLRGDE